jgi:ParB family chromosome partitioning protein
MNQKKPALGKGLDALLGQIAANRHNAPKIGASAGLPGGAQTSAAADAPRAPVGEELARLPVTTLQRGRYQPRVDMREESLQELADSIRSQGVVQPIVVRPLDGASGDAPRYEIIAGERRWRAAQLAGLTHIPAVVRRVPDEAAIAMALIENIQREDLNPLEEARALDRLLREFGVTHQQAADVVGRSRAAVSNLLRLLELPTDVASMLEGRQLEMGHARALLGLTNRRQQSELAALVAKKGISVRETEALVRKLAQSARPMVAADAKGVALDPNVAKLQDELADKLGATVQILHSTASGKGKLVINYHSLDELDGILKHIQ